MDTHHTVAPLEFLSFSLGGMEYGLDCSRVQELKMLKSLERVAADGGIIGGVALSRGVVLPVVDLRAGACHPAASDPHLEVIILRLAASLVGLVVGRVNDVVRLGPDQVRPPGCGEGGEGADYLIGIGCIGARRLILVDIERLMSLAPVRQAA
ncbi:chemotaxis protein CheW [Massilia niastensis]|uniref:chemotaxis protein CheW n=1 Tax=Massilia niastensis TaxID=544911 RepID=UPI000362F0E3|nr:chemotaxis protein CheW [Massilia niastensis]